MEASNRNDVQTQLERVGMSAKELPKSDEIIEDIEGYANLCVRISEMMKSAGFDHLMVFACHQTQAIDLLTKALKIACNQRDGILEYISRSKTKCEFCSWNEREEFCSKDRSALCRSGFSGTWEMNRALWEIMRKEEVQPCSTQPILQM